MIDGTQGPIRQQIKAGALGQPEVSRVQERIGLLRGFRWSSYRAYAGLVQGPDWLECESILALGGGKREERRANYRDYVEKAMREGLERSPWEEVKEQVALGGERFLHRLRQYVKGDEREQRGVKRLAARRLNLEQIIACVEKVKGAKWGEFRDRHGDSGRDLVLYLGRRACGLKLEELARAVGLKEYAAVGMAVTRYAKRLSKDKLLEKEFRRVNKMLNVNVEM